MNQWFWESYQKARRDYFCDWCSNWIQPGELYKRVVWVPHRGDRFQVMREHSDPHCPPNEGELHMHELYAKERLGVPVVLIAKERLVVAIDASGRTMTESELCFVPTLICEALGASDFEEEIPF